MKSQVGTSLVGGGPGALGRLASRTFPKNYYLHHRLKYFSYPYFCFWYIFLLLVCVYLFLQLSKTILWYEIVGMPDYLWRDVSCLSILPAKNSSSFLPCFNFYSLIVFFLYTFYFPYYPRFVLFSASDFSSRSFPLLFLKRFLDRIFWKKYSASMNVGMVENLMKWLFTGSLSG